MNATAAICAALLKGDVLSIKMAFNEFGVTNLPREMGRAIERKFGVRISRAQEVGLTRWGTPSNWFTYRLNRDAPENQEGIKKMRSYLREHLPDPKDAKTQVQKTRYQQAQKLLLF